MGVPKRYAARRDGNEGPLLAIARQMGARVKLSGPLDAWVHTAKLGWFPVEIKDPDGRNRLTPDQVDFVEWCQAWKMPVAIWRYTSDVIKTIEGDTPWKELAKLPSKSSSKASGTAKNTDTSGTSTKSPSSPTLESVISIADRCL